VGCGRGPWQRSPSATCVLRGAQPWQATQAPHGAGVCPTLRHDLAPRVRWCLPSTQVAAEAPRVPTWFFFDSNNNFLKFINDDDNNNNNNNNNF